jgi:hypothetical protein
MSSVARLLMALITSIIFRGEYRSCDRHCRLRSSNVGLLSEGDVAVFSGADTQLVFD